MSGEDALKGLWQAVFGDGPDEINRFFDTFYAPERAVTLTDGGRIAAMAHIVPVGELVLGSRRLPCAFIYAVAAAPALRGRGYGRRVVERASERALELGFEAVVLRPASPPLFDFYAALGYRPFFTACSLALDPKSVIGSETAALRRLPPDKYAPLRRRFLQGAAFIDFDPKALAYQETLCGSGGGLFMAERGGAALGLAIIEAEGEDVFVKELLCAPEDFLHVRAALQSAYPSRVIRVRAPAFCLPPGAAKPEPFGMVYGNPPGEAALSPGAGNWYGPAFD